jgi:hypothetical protein
MRRSWALAQARGLNVPFAFALVGLILLVAGVRGTSGDLVDLVKNDLTGDNNFVYWIVAVGALGALGYIDSLRTFSRALLALVLVVLVLTEGNKTGSGGLFSKFTQAIDTITERAA